MRYWFFALCLGVGWAAGAAAGGLESLPETLARIKPSIVGVGTYKPTGRPPLNLRGTGFVVGDGRHALTNLHVLQEKMDAAKKETLAVFVGTGESPSVRPAEVAAKDALHDIVLLKFSDEPVPPLSLGDSDRVREGELYAFTGFPIGAVLGLYPVTHHGLISAISPAVIPVRKSRQLTSEMIRLLKEPFLMLQLDATAYPGNSGSPLYDPASGEVMGILNKVLVFEGKESALKHPTGISYAIPSNIARALLVKAGLSASKPSVP